MATVLLFFWEKSFVIYVRHLHFEILYYLFMLKFTNVKLYFQKLKFVVSTQKYLGFR